MANSSVSLNSLVVYAYKTVSVVKGHHQDLMKFTIELIAWCLKFQLDFSRIDSKLDNSVSKVYALLVSLTEIRPYFYMYR